MWEGVDWIRLAQVKVLWRVFVNLVMKLKVQGISKQLSVSQVPWRFYWLTYSSHPKRFHHLKKTGKSLLLKYYVNNKAFNCET